MKKNVLIYCNCGAGIISEAKQAEIAEVMRQANTDVVELHDLCAYSVNEKEALSSINSEYGKKLIVACYPRAIENMFRQNGIEMENFEVINFREKSADQIKQEVDTKIEAKSENSSYEVLKNSLDVPAWYPVIEESRCIYCGKCARFCVFGVYKFSKKSLEVVEPLNCKNNCPACGRTCPTSAIIFPRLRENSVLSGADPDSGAPKFTVAPQGGSLLTALNNRNTARRNIFKQDMMQLAEDEKQKAIEELKRRAEEKND